MGCSCCLSGPGVCGAELCSEVLIQEQGGTKEELLSIPNPAWGVILPFLSLPLIPCKMGMRIFLFFFF